MSQLNICYIGAEGLAIKKPKLHDLSSHF